MLYCLQNGMELVHDSDTQVRLAGRSSMHRLVLHASFASPHTSALTLCREHGLATTAHASASPNELHASSLHPAQSPHCLLISAGSRKLYLCSRNQSASHRSSKLRLVGCWRCSLQVQGRRIGDWARNRVAVSNLQRSSLSGVQPLGTPFCINGCQPEGLRGACRMGGRAENGEPRVGLGWCQVLAKFHGVTDTGLHD